MENLTPLIHNSLLSENEVKPLNQEDMACIKEIRDILKKHNRLERFGINLLHKHFELDDDEILIESVDEKARIQTISPLKVKDINELDGDVLETSWSLQDGKTLLGCRRACVQSGGSHHYTHVFS